MTLRRSAVDEQHDVVLVGAASSGAVLAHDLGEVPAGRSLEGGEGAELPDAVGATAAGRGDHVGAPADPHAGPRRACSRGPGRRAACRRRPSGPFIMNDQLDPWAWRFGDLVGAGGLVLGDGLLEHDLQPELSGLGLEGVLGVDGRAGPLVDDADLLAAAAEHVLDEARAGSWPSGPRREDREDVVRGSGDLLVDVADDRGTLCGRPTERGRRSIR